MSERVLEVLLRRYAAKLAQSSRPRGTLEFFRPGIGVEFPQPPNPVHQLQRSIAQELQGLERHDTIFHVDETTWPD